MYLFSMQNFGLSIGFIEETLFSLSSITWQLDGPPKDLKGYFLGRILLSVKSACTFFYVLLHDYLLRVDAVV